MISERLFHLRTKNDMTQQEVADAADIDRVAYSRYENGTRIPKGDVVGRLARSFGVSTDFIIGTSPDPTPSDRTIDTTDLSWGLYENSRDLSDAEKQELMEIIEIKKRLKKG